MTKSGKQRWHNLAETGTISAMLRPWMVVLIFLIGYLSIIFFIHDRDSKSFVVLGSCFKQCTGIKECTVPDGAKAADVEGYDGQFNYYIASDPVHAAPCIDVPAYRYQRILLPVLGWLLSVGNESLIPLIFVLINSLAMIIGTRLLEDLLVRVGQSRWFALTYGLFAGLLLGVRLSTNEPLAYGLVIAAIWAYQKNQFWGMAIALALAGLAKETTLLFTAGFLLWFALNRRWQDALRFLAVVGLPFLVWQLYLYNWLGEVGIGSGGAKATGFEIIPFGGVLKIWTEGNFNLFLLRGVFVIGIFFILPTLWSFYRLARDYQGQQITLYSCLLLINVIIMPFVPFSTYREYLGILRFVPGLVLMVVLYSAERDLKRPLRYAAEWLVLLIFLGVG